MPAMISNATFIAAIQGMTVTGVTRHFDDPPESLSTADLPAAFPLWPGSNMLDMVTSCIDTGKTRTMGFVICVEASGQGTNATKYAQYAALMDNLETALETAFPATTVNYYTFEYNTVPGYPVADQTYWAIVATIQVMATLGG